MSQYDISVIIPQYKTYKISRLCLDAIRKFSKSKIQIIVVDNNSRDESIAYLRELNWINLIENPDAKVGGEGHKEALDLGIKFATGKWILFFHSDTIVIKDGWDKDLLELVESVNGAVGASTVIREVNLFTPWYKKIIRSIRGKTLRQTFTLKDMNQKIMSYCFLIQRDFLHGTNFQFKNSSGDVADYLYQHKIKGLHPFLILGTDFLEPRMWHTSNVSSILTGQITDKALIKKFDKKIKSLTSSRVIKDLISDS